MTLILTLALFGTMPTDEITGVVTDECSTIELNTTYDDEGRKVLRQIIFWQQSETGQEIRAWRLHRDYYPTRDFARDCWTLTFHDGDITRVVRAKYFRVTHRQWDIEMKARGALPKELRRPLTPQDSGMSLRPLSEACILNEPTKRANAMSALTTTTFLGKGHVMANANTTPKPPTPASITFQGRTMTSTEWAKEMGVLPQTLRFRLRSGWSVEEALTRSVGDRNRHVEAADEPPATVETKRIERFPGYVFASDGNVWSKRSGSWKTLAITFSNAGYALLALSVNGKKYHRPTHQLICEAFHGPRPQRGYEVCHNDGNSRNNAASNLRWDTRKANVADAIRHGTFRRGTKCGGKIQESDVRHIRRLKAMGFRISDIARSFKIANSAVYKIAAGMNWGWLQ